ncbi:hypothetical protein Hypma_016553 [Hypsizygus marmoreus]|uniref:Uncharacterized protein n=1 Tax=Hypsizygus marmoreus TaxID=39966 RepID=A0A369J514_HYPMA|nr:hypothetical protein Hypma_016553 [Hypsizygus marmoreus]
MNVRNTADKTKFTQALRLNRCPLKDDLIGDTPFSNISIIVSYTLSPISGLVAEPAHEATIVNAIKAEDSCPRGSARSKKIAAMKVPLKPYADDVGLDVARHKEHDSYFYIGQCGLLMLGLST